MSPAMLGNNDSDVGVGTLYESLIKLPGTRMALRKLRRIAWWGTVQLYSSYYFALPLSDCDVNR